ncbi:hypothetical protein [Saccharopolyspora tripterygii]
MGKQPGATMVNIRMRETLISKVDQAAETASLQRSAWCRELITAAIESGLSLHELCQLIGAAPSAPPTLFPLLPGPASEPPKRELGRRRILTGGCLHPVHQVRRYPTVDVCAGCDTVLRQR